MIKVLLNVSAIFYSILCLFSVVTGIIYMSGKRKLNPLELPDKFVKKLEDNNNIKRFTFDAGLLTFVVGLVQGLTAYCLFSKANKLHYYIALGFTIFSISSALLKLKGKINIFPIIKSIAYISILIILLLSQSKMLFI